MDTFFLAEPFKPEIFRVRRERAVKNAIRDALEEEFSEARLRIADKEPKEAIFCDVCRLIQSSAYGIADISESNPNVLMELGMMFSLGKPVFVLVKKSEEDSLKEKLPSDIVWKRVIPYEEFIDIQEELTNQIRNRPKVTQRPSIAEEAREVFTQLDPAFAAEMEAKFQEIRREQKEGLKKLEKMLEDVGLARMIPREKEAIPSSYERQINDIYDKVERMEELVGFSGDADVAFLRGNWHVHRKEYERALELFDWTLYVKPDSEDAWYNKGYAFSELGRHEEALPCYDKAIELKPDYEEAWYNKGVALDELGRHEEALPCYDKAIELKPDDEAAWNAKGSALAKLGKHEEAKTCYDKAKKTKSDIEES